MFVVMDFQFWIYIIIAVIYVLSRALKKPESAAPKHPERRTVRPGEAGQVEPSRPRPLTFEELLREITEAKQPVKPYTPQAEPFRPQPRSEVVDYDDELAEEEQDLETIQPDYRKKEEQFNNIYEDAKRQAFERPSLEETMNVRDTVMEFGKFKSFDQKKKTNLLQEYTKDLKDPAGLKKAFVLSEILNRKF
jgi:hypothetical protein